MTRKTGYRMWNDKTRNDDESGLRDLLKTYERAEKQDCLQSTLDYYAKRITEKRAEVVAMYGDSNY